MDGGTIFLEPLDVSVFVGEAITVGFRCKPLSSGLRVLDTGLPLVFGSKETLPVPILLGEMGDDGSSTGLSSLDDLI